MVVSDGGPFAQANLQLWSAMALATPALQHHVTLPYSCLRTGRALFQRPGRRPKGQGGEKVVACAQRLRNRRAGGRGEVSVRVGVVVAPRIQPLVAPARASDLVRAWSVGAAELAQRQRGREGGRQRERERGREGRERERERERAEREARTQPITTRTRYWYRYSLGS